MTQTLTYICKLHTSEQQAKHIDDTLVTFAEACNWIHKTVPNRIRNRVPFFWNDA